MQHLSAWILTRAVQFLLERNQCSLCSVLWEAKLALSNELLRKLRPQEAWFFSSHHRGVGGI